MAPEEYIVHTGHVTNCHLQKIIVWYSRTTSSFIGNRRGHYFIYPSVGIVQGHRIEDDIKPPVIYDRYMSVDRCLCHLLIPPHVRL